MRWNLIRGLLICGMMLCPHRAHAEQTSLNFDVAAVIAGIGDARDGDDILFGNVAIRLRGVAAPEDRKDVRDPGGADATEHLQGLVRGKETVCYLDGSVARARPVGVCFVEGKDLGLLQVLAGYARDCPRFSAGMYADAEKQARSDGNELNKIYPLPSYC